MDQSGPRSKWIKGLKRHLPKGPQRNSRMGIGQWAMETFGPKLGMVEWKARDPGSTMEFSINLIQLNSDFPRKWSKMGHKVIHAFHRGTKMLDEPWPSVKHDHANRAKYIVSIKGARIFELVLGKHMAMSLLQRVKYLRAHKAVVLSWRGQGRGGSPRGGGTRTTIGMTLLTTCNLKGQ